MPRSAKTQSVQQLGRLPNALPTPSESEMMCKTVNILAILCALAGCSVIQQKAEMDASTAATIAANSGDTAGAACFKALEPVVGTAPSRPPQQVRGRPRGSDRGRGRAVRAARRRVVPASVEQASRDPLTGLPAQVASRTKSPAAMPREPALAAPERARSDRNRSRDARGIWRGDAARVPACSFSAETGGPEAGQRPRNGPGAQEHPVRWRGRSRLWRG